jgi:phage gp29-like protein
MDEVAVASIRDRFSSYPSVGLTPQRLARIFREADEGDILRQAELFEEMEEKDPHLYSLLQTRKNAVLGLDYDVIPFSDDPRDREVADFIAEALDHILGFEDALLDLLDAIGKGLSGTEIMWEIADGRVWARELRWVPQKRFTFTHDTRELRLLTDQNPVQGIELPANKFIVHKYKAKSGHPSRQGVLRVVAWMYLFKNYTLKDWVAFAEIFGMPLRLGKYDPGTSQEDREKLLQAVVQLGTDAAGIISRNTDIEFIETKGTGGASVYQGLANFCNAEMSKAILGQTLTTEVGSRGSYAASQTHAEVRQDLLEADCKALAETLRRDLIRPLVRFNFGPEARLPWIKFHYEPPEDLAAESKTYATLVKEVGLPIAAEHVYEKFGIPKPEAGQTLVTPPSGGAMPLKGLALSDGDPRTAQGKVDRLADLAVIQALPVVRDLLELVKRAIAEATSLEELRERLAELYGQMALEEFEDLVQRALYAADLYGRYTVING